MKLAPANVIVVLGQPLLLVEIGDGTQVHLARKAPTEYARPALLRDRLDESHPWYVPTATNYDPAALAEPRWSPQTFCGRGWDEMCAGDAGPLYRWQEPAFSPTCRTCLAALDRWFPSAAPPDELDLLASVVADKVEQFGASEVFHVPPQHIDSTRRAIRRHLRGRGHRSATYLLNGVVHVFSDDAYDAIDPAVKQMWDGEMAGVLSGDPTPRVRQRAVERLVDWRTWVSSE